LHWIWCWITSPISSRERKYEHTPRKYRRPPIHATLPSASWKHFDVHARMSKLGCGQLCLSVWGLIGMSGRKLIISSSRWRRLLGSHVDFSSMTDASMTSSLRNWDGTGFEKIVRPSPMIVWLCSGLNPASVPILNENLAWRLGTKGCEGL
jgi:hypothetical protein